MSVNRKPCGCTMTEREGAPMLFKPCVPCGLRHAGWLFTQAARSIFRRGRYLREAGNALAAVATTIRESVKQQADVAKVVDEVLEQANEDDE